MKPVGDNKHGAALDDFAHVLVDDAFRLVVESARRFVEDQNARIRYKRPGDGDALTLTARQRAAAFANHRIVAVGQLQDEIRGRQRDARLPMTCSVGIPGLARAILSRTVALKSTLSCITTPI